MKKWICLLACIASVLSAEEDPLELIPSAPDEVAARLSDGTALIGGLISPISGQLCLRTNDLTVIGAQNLEFGRVYLPVGLSAPTPVQVEMEQYLQEKEFLLTMQKNFRGWVFLPHVYLERTTRLQTRLTDAGGATLTFEHKNDGSQSKLVFLHGISNASQDRALGQFDMRNIRFSFGEEAKVFFPNGTIRIYKPIDNRIFLLDKEILPNGKIMRYFFEGNRLKRIESRDRTDTQIYASITLDRNMHRLPYHLKDHPKKEKCGDVKNKDVGSRTYRDAELHPEWIITEATGSTGDTATYGHEPLTCDRILRKKCGTFEYHITFPSPLKNASTPHYRNEEIVNKDFQISHYAGKDHTFNCTYEQHRVNTLFLPVGEDDAMKPVYQMSYVPPQAGKKEGKTTVHRIDGAKIEYLISKELLLDAILYYDLQGNLQKEKKYHWDDHHRLQAVELKDGQGNLLFKTLFEDYDSFGNPQTEKFTGEKVEPYVIKREYDQNRLKREENEEGKVVVYEYFQDTNLPSAKYTQDGEKVILREFWIYDDSANLIEKSIDDGKFRKIARYRLRQEQPFLHMPEWIEDWTSDGKEEWLIKKAHLIYDKRGHINLEEIYDSEGHFAYNITREYDEQGNLTSETNPLNHTVTSTYTPKGQLATTETFSHRLKIHKSYDARGRLQKVEQNDHETTYKYDDLDRCRKSTDYLGNATLFEYDPISFGVTKTEGPPILSIDNHILAVNSFVTYDCLGRKQTSTDANGNITTYTYNAYGSPVEINYPDGGVEIYQYEKNGLLKSHTTHDHLVTEFTYDIQQRLIEKKYLFEGRKIASEQWAYDALYLRTYTDKEGYTTTYDYDSAGRKISETICGRTTTFAYDRLGRLNMIQYEHGQWIQFEKDFLGQILAEKTTDEKGTLYHLIQYTYDPDGNRTTITRFPHNKKATETFTYDPFHRLTERRDALDHATTTVYQENLRNSLGSRILTTLITDPNGIVTKRSYDPYGRLSQLQVGTSYTQERFYDAAGNLLQMQEGTLLNRYEFSPTHLLTAHTRAYGTSDARTTTYSYTKGGQLSTKTLPNGTCLTYTYTPLGYLLTKTSSDGSLAQTFTHSLTGHLLTASDGHHSVKREIDPFGNILSEEIDGLILTKTYDPLNRLKTITLPDRSSILYEYDPAYLRSIKRLSSQNLPLYTHTYESYDQAGNLLSEQLIHGLGKNSHIYNPTGTKHSVYNPYFNQRISYDPGSRVQDTSEGHYEYNELSEITLEQFAEATLIYDYDSHHNRIQKNDLIIEHNLLDEPTYQSYDLNGNLKKHNQFHLDYDALNRLTRARNNETETLFHYDPLDRCISASINGAQEFYLYHNSDELGSFTSNGSTKELKVPGLSAPIALEIQGQAFAPLCDHIGSIRCWINSATIPQKVDYTAFGEGLSGKPIIWGYSGKRFYQQLGLYNFGKRFYDPISGRWITTDPAGQIDGTNLYAYALNNPLLYRDFDGQSIGGYLLGLGEILLGGTIVAGGFVLEVATLGGFTIGFGVTTGTGAFLMGHGLLMTTYHAQDIKAPSISWKNTDVYAPDRPLPLTEDGIPIPETDAPHTQLGTRGSKRRPGEKYPQAREFDKNGKPVKTIDFTDHGEPDIHPNPHEHPSDPNPTGGTPQRGDPRRLENWEY
jgi:RHS repeat-associated protein